MLMVLDPVNPNKYKGIIHILKLFKLHDLAEESVKFIKVNVTYLMC